VDAFEDSILEAKTKAIEVKPSPIEITILLKRHDSLQGILTERIMKVKAGKSNNNLNLINDPLSQFPDVIEAKAFQAKANTVYSPGLGPRP